MIGDYCTIKEITEKTGISRGTIYNLEKKKKIVFKRLSGKVYIRLKDIENALE